MLTVGRGTSGGGAPGMLKLFGGAGAATEYYVLVDSSGNLRIGTTQPTDVNFSATGTIVGTQS
jgi:hypothetical protein